MSMLLQSSVPVMTSQVLTPAPQVSQVLSTPVVSQPSLAVMPQPLIDPLVQPIVQPVLQPLAQPIVQPIAPAVAAPLVSTTIPTVVPPIPTPLVMTPPPLAPKPVSQPIEYSRFIPPTPVTDSLRNERALQMMQLAPTPVPAPVTVPAPATVLSPLPAVTLPQVAAFPTVSVPVVNSGLALGAPQFGSFTLV